MCRERHTPLGGLPRTFQFSASTVFWYGFRADGVHTAPLPALRCASPSAAVCAAAPAPLTTLSSSFRPNYLPTDLHPEAKFDVGAQGGPHHPSAPPQRCPAWLQTWKKRHLTQRKTHSSAFPKLKMSSTPSLTDLQISRVWSKVIRERASLSSLETEFSGSSSAACLTASIALDKLHHLPRPILTLRPTSHSYLPPAASCDEQLVITGEIAQCKSEIEALQQQLFVSALAQIAGEVASPDFTAAFAAASGGTGIESFRRMNELPLDVQVCVCIIAALRCDSSINRPPPSFYSSAPINATA